MKRGLELFVEALEQHEDERFISRIVLNPMQKPAYKELTIEIYRIQGIDKELYTTSTQVYMITNESEKESAIDDLTKNIIRLVLNRKV